MESNQQSQSFYQFSDQLRLHSSNLANLSLNDSIWSVNNPYAAVKKPESRRNFDVTVGGGVSGDKRNMNMNPPSQVNSSDYNVFSNDGWKLGSGFGSGNVNLNGGFNKGVYSNSKGVNNNLNNNYVNNYNNGSYNYKGQKNVNWKGEDEHGIMVGGGKHGKKNKDVKKENYNNNKEKNNDNNDNNNGKSGVDKRFKTLPAAEALPRNEIVGGYIFVCNNDTMEENLKRQLFGLPPRYRDSVRQITPGLPLFLYNYSTHQLHGIYEASSFGGTNIDPAAWEDKKNPGESRFPAQVRVHTRKLCEPLDEDAFRPILHHYDGPKFRLELSVPEALSLLDIFDENNA